MPPASCRMKERSWARPDLHPPHGSPAHRTGLTSQTQLSWDLLQKETRLRLVIFISLEVFLGSLRLQHFCLSPTPMCSGKLEAVRCLQPFCNSALSWKRQDAFPFLIQLCVLVVTTSQLDVARYRKWTALQEAICESKIKCNFLLLTVLRGTAQPAPRWATLSDNYWGGWGIYTGDAIWGVQAGEEDAFWDDVMAADGADRWKPDPCSALWGWRHLSSLRSAPGLPGWKAAVRLKASDSRCAS